MDGAQRQITAAATVATADRSARQAAHALATRDLALQIQSARLGELPALAHLQRRSFALDRGYGLATCFMLWCARGPQLLAARDAAGQLVGMVIVDRRRGRTPHGRILNLCVAPEHRLRGYGRALLDAAERAVPAARYVLLVDQKNQPAIALYESHGYQIAGLEPSYYGRHRHALLMQKG